MFGGNRVAHSFDASSVEDLSLGMMDRDQADFERSDSVDGSITGAADNYLGPGGEPNQVRAVAIIICLFCKIWFLLL